MLAAGLGGHLSAALAEGQAGTSAVTRPSAEQLSELDAAEQSILSDGKAAPSAPAQGALKAALEEKRQLELQQERLVSEILKLRRQVQQLQRNVSTPETEGAKIDAREHELIKELQRERLRNAALEQEVADIKTRGVQSIRERARSEAQSEIDQERSRNRALEQEIEDLKKRLQLVDRRKADKDELLERAQRAEGVALKLEQNLESAKKLAADNQFIRDENAKLRAQIGSTEQLRKAVNDSAKALAAANEQIATLSTEKADLQKRYDAFEEKYTTERSKLADIFAQMKADLEQSKATITSLTEERDKLTTQLQELETLRGAKAASDAAIAKAQQDIQTAEQQRDEIATRVGELTAALSEARSNVETAAKAREEIDAELAGVKKSLGEREVELAEVKRQLSRTIEDARKFSETADEQSKVAARIPDLEQQISSLQTQLGQKDIEVKTLSSQLQDKEQLLGSLPALRKQLVELKNELLMKETELQMLGRRDGRKAPASSVQVVSASGSAAPESAPGRDILREAGKLAGQETIKIETAAKSDVMIVEVTADKVNLRSGPGPENSMVMQVQRGNKLTVEAREGDWFRVVTPVGSRAFIRSDVVRVLPSGISPAVTGGGADPLQTASESQPSARPKKPPVRAIQSQDMVPFGEVSEKPAKRDSVDRAFERLKSTLGTPR